MKHLHSCCSKWLLTLLCVSMLGSCGGKSSHKTPEPENPYILQANTHIHNGLAAMQKERWQSAESSFARALVSSQLADDINLVSRSWYNLAVIRSALNNNTGAEEAYGRVLELADRHRDSLMQMRAQIALALIQEREGHLPETFDIQQLPASLFQAGNWPADIRLQAARLAQRLQHSALAQQAYLTITQTKGSDRNLLKMKAEAHMGLALLARSESRFEQAWAEAEKALGYCRVVGAPRLTAHALLLQGQLGIANARERKDRLERALSIYVALEDTAGQKQTLAELIKLNSPESTPALQLRLQQLEDKLGKENEKPESFSIMGED